MLAGAGAIVFIGVYLLVIALIFASFWKIFTKAGQPGWAGLVPIYNIIVLLNIVGLPVWFIVLMFVPCINFFVGIYVTYGLVKSFGKDVGFVILLILLPMVGYPLLAFGDSKYVGPALKK